MRDEDNNNDNDYINSGASTSTQRAVPFIDGHTSMADNSQASASPPDRNDMSSGSTSDEQQQHLPMRQSTPSQTNDNVASRQTTNASTALDAFEQRLMEKALSKKNVITNNNEDSTNQTHHREPTTEDEEVVNMRMVNAKIGRENLVEEQTTNQAHHVSDIIPPSTSLIMQQEQHNMSTTDESSSNIHGLEVVPDDKDLPQPSSDFDDSIEKRKKTTGRGITNDDNSAGTNLVNELMSPPTPFNIADNINPIERTPRREDIENEMLCPLCNNCTYGGDIESQSRRRIGVRQSGTLPNSDEPIQAEHESEGEQERISTSTVLVPTAFLVEEEERRSSRDRREVFNAIPIPPWWSQILPWWKKQRRTHILLLLLLGVVVLLAVALGVSLSTTGDTIVVVQYKFNYVKEALRIHEHLTEVLTESANSVEFMKDYGFKHADGPTTNRDSFSLLADSVLFNTHSSHNTALYYAMEDGSYYGFSRIRFSDRPYVWYREPGNAGYAVDTESGQAVDIAMQKHYLSCVNEKGEEIPCLMNSGEKYISCIDDCASLQRCDDEDSQRDCSKIGDMKEKALCKANIKWCTSYDIKEIQDDKRGYIPRSSHCADQNGLAAQASGTVQISFDTDTKLGNCYYKDRVTEVSRNLAGEYAYCGSGSCNNTFVGAYQTV